MQTLESWLEHISAQHWQTIDMGLSRMQTMVQRLDLTRPAPVVITVAGTNGKGSTSMACEALLSAAGIKTGTTLSPHVSSFNERVRIAAEEADDAFICQAFAAVEQQREDLPLTYFEFAALAALWCFKRARVDVAILEIGLGGRLDAFNAIDADIAVITSIGLDHVEYLGDTRAAIGAEKAGILRRGQRVVLGPDMPHSVQAACVALDLQPLSLGEDYDIAVQKAGAGQPANWSVRHHGRVVAADLNFGQCAPQNLLLACLAVADLFDNPFSALAGVAATLAMPGRLQIVRRAERTWVLDVAHNPAGAEFLCEQLLMRGLQPQLVVCGMLCDKDHAGVYERVSTRFAAPWYSVDTHGERGLAAAELAAELPIAVRPFTDMKVLIGEVNSATKPGDVILLFGSFNVIEQFDLVLKTASTFDL